MEKNYDIRYDFIRVVAMALIVCIHVSACLVTQYGQVSAISWNFSNFIDAFSRMSVDIFIMLSGTLLLSKNEGVIHFYSKRLKKVVIPFLFWTVFYTFWGKYYKGYNMSIKETLLKAYNAQTYYHLWFLYAIIVLYLVAPLFKIILKYIPEKISFVICVLWILILTPNWLNRFGQFQGKIPIIKWSYTSFDYILEYGAYFVLGYVLINYLHRLNKRKVYLMGIITFVFNFIIFIGTTYLSKRNGIFDGRLYYSPGIFVAISSITGYIFLYGIADIFNEKIEKYKKLIHISSNCSFGVYLIHICIMEIILISLHYSVVLTHVTAILSLPVLIILVFVISTVIVYYGKKIPVVKHIF